MLWKTTVDIDWRVEKPHHSLSCVLSNVGRRWPTLHWVQRKLCLYTLMGLSQPNAMMWGPLRWSQKQRTWRAGNWKRSDMDLAAGSIPDEMSVALDFRASNSNGSYPKYLWNHSHQYKKWQCSPTHFIVETDRRDPYHSFKPVKQKSSVRVFGNKIRLNLKSAWSHFLAFGSRVKFDMAILSYSFHI